VAQLESADEHRLFAEVIAATRVGLSVWELTDPDDPAGMRLVHANPVAAAVLGAASDELIGRPLREIAPGAVRTGRPAIYAEIALGAEARVLATVSARSDHDGEHWYSVRAFPLSGHRVGVAFNDVTGERSAEARALQILESMSDGFLAFDADWRYVYWNREAERTGLLSSELRRGGVIWELVPELVGSPFHEACQRAARDGVTATFDEYGFRDRWYSVRIFPSADGVAVYFHDITEHKSMEARLRQSDKLEAVGSLAGGVAHDFNNALTVIRGAAALALAAVGEGAARDNLQQIDDAAHHAATLTQQLLAFSRRQVLRPRVTDLNAIVSQTVDLAERLIGEDVAVDRRLEPGLQPVLVDRNQLQQVIINLCVNARDAMPAGGTLAIRTTTAVLDEAYAHGRADVVPGQYDVLEVTDAGTGMDEATRARIFDPFFTTKEGGTGLGLATVFGIVKQSGGHIEVYSEPGMGTTFKVYLPFATGATADEVEEPAPTDQRGGTETILLVEDHEMLRPLLLDVLQGYGYSVHPAASADEALAIAAGHEGVIDLLLTDVVMPGLNGGELAERLAATHPGMKVLFTSGFPAGTVVERGITESRVAFLQKPFLADELAGKVRAVLDEPSR
jgi:two-component system, cell cycle sensor histidine kinase and response regulator CckA